MDGLEVCAVAHTTNHTVHGDSVASFAAQHCIMDSLTMWHAP